MRVVFAKRVSGQTEFGIIYGGIALAALCAVRLPSVLSFIPSCTFKRLTGLPCPTCGSTRSLTHLAHGDIFAALAMNPLAAAGVLTAVLFFLYGIVALLFNLPRVKVLLTVNEGNALRSSAAAILLIQWIYLLLRFS